MNINIYVGLYFTFFFQNKLTKIILFTNNCKNVCGNLCYKEEYVIQI